MRFSQDPAAKERRTGYIASIEVENLGVLAAADMADIGGESCVVHMIVHHTAE
jgi:hypothetical protein